MELPDRLIKLESLDLTCCEFLKTIDLDDYLSKNLKNQLNDKKLESLRLTLYHRYNSIKQCKPIQLDFQNELILLIKNWDILNEEVLCDVVVLLLVNFVDPKLYIETFNDLKESILTINDEKYRIKYFKIFRTILEAVELKNGVIEESFHFWIQQVAEEAIDWGNWRLLHFILPKISNSKFIWTKIFKLDDRSSMLNAACVLSDYFTLDDVNVKLWEIIWQSLISKDFQNRKKALYMFKKISDIPNVSSCCEKDDLKNYFILVLESLEEKQKHLIIPILPIIDTLVEENKNHRRCENCVHNKSVFCIFSRLLVHDSNFVKKWGLYRSLRLDAEVFDEEFVNLIVCCLNETFLYEDLSIVEALGTWLTNQKLFQRFLCLLPSISWGSIAIFYILQALSIAAGQIDDLFLNQESIDAIKSLIERNIKIGTPLLRLASQYELFKILSKIVDVQDLMLVIELLCTFEQRLLVHPEFRVTLNEMTSRVCNENVVTFVTKICHEQNVPMRIFALLVQSFHESNNFLAKKEVDNFLVNLDKIDVRPFVDVSLIMKIFDFINHINLTFFSMSNFSQGIYDFGLKLLNKNDFLYEHVEICLRILEKLEIYLSSNQLLVIRGRYESRCIEIFENAKYHSKVQILFAINLLHWCRSTIFIEQYLSNNLDKLLIICDNDHAIHEKTLEGNKLTAEFFVALTKHVENRVNILSIENLNHDVVNWMDFLSSILDRAGNEILMHSGSLIKKYCWIQRFEINKTQKFHRLIDNFWNYNFNSKRNKTFWDVSKILITSVLSAEFLDSEKAHLDYAIGFADRIMREGDILPGLKYILLAYCDFSNHVNSFSDFILNGAFHGCTMRRDQRIFMQAQKEAKSMHYHDSSSVYEILNGQSNVDAAIRTVAIVQILKGLQANTNNSAEFLRLVLAKLSVFGAKRYYADSQLHRLKQRLMQILLILQPALDRDSSSKLFEALTEVVIRDSDQHSIRIMLEWNIALICLKYKYDPELWQLFENVLDKRPGSANSILGIIWLVANKLKDNELIVFGKKALTYISTCCIGQQYTMRFYGQILFVKLFELLTSHDADLKQHVILYNSCLKSLEYGNSKKNFLKIEDDFYFNVFDASRHYTLETIFYELPRLCNVSSEEWLNIGDFEEYVVIKSLDSIKIYNTDRDLSKAAVPPHMSKKADNTFNSEEVENFEAGNDLQKKIIPWKTLCPDIDCLDEFRKEVKVHDKTDMIVVASLVEKSQNLGGIARTCEIFGVNKIVLSNLKQTEDKEFQSLSVSSDRWLKIVEVKIFELSKYLLEMKNLGWTLVGAEQTANSKNLVDYKFDKKTLLVLGNEKDGISANIIPLLDICIEIPQIGVTRSLNVHVTSAICIWEYLKQQCF